MGQPVRKIIKENNNIQEKPFYTLLVDGNSLLRRSFADTKVNSEGLHYGAVFQFLLQLNMMLKRRPFEYIYVTFDNHSSGILRYQLYKGYKANRDKNYGDDFVPESEKSEYWKQYEETLKKMQTAIYNKQHNKPKKEKSAGEKFIDENFARERDILRNYFEDLYIRCIYDDIVEGDDVIAYYIKNKKPEERIIIMSGDHDLTQLVNDTVCIYDLNTKKVISKDNFKELRGIVPENVALMKIFTGDTSDNIKGIYGLSETRLLELMPEIKNRKVEINEVKERAKIGIEKRIKEKKSPYKWQENIINGVSGGEYDGDFYEINEKIINLKEPLLTEEAKEEIDNLMYNSMDPEGRSFDNLYAQICKDSIDELKDSNKFAVFFEPFKEFANREIKRYKENI